MVLKTGCTPVNRHKVLRTMAVTAQQRQDVRGEGEAVGLRILPQDISKQTLDDWKDSAAEYVRTELFAKKQFVRDEQLVAGGAIQVLVCNYIKICGKERARIFWDEKGGKETVRNTFRRKRQAAQNSMKLAFRGKCGSAKNQT
jgi:hypothetical protein